VSTTLRFVSELDRIAGALDSADAGAPQLSLPTIAEKVARIMGVRKEEVAILAVSTRWKHLHFLLPEVLKNVGFIPLTSTSSLAAKTVRESHPEIDNNFSTSRHPRVFEGIKINGETPEFIQKIISAPILFDGRVIGVIQISRKGGNAFTAGPDFTSDDLGNLLALCKPLGKLIQRAVDV
jgi:hypothetical protein